ncbi:MAG TPA: hypothetical protein VKU40_19620 [Thermoanaerobaculia bacterium]|nr:hypothetical protein [Thermoanaerobaculia bacterium]
MKRAMKCLGTLAILGLLLVACGAGGGGAGGAPGGGDRLSAEQCQELFDQIFEIVSRGVPLEEQEMARGTAEEEAETLRSCVDGETWGPKGYDCVMKATTESELRTCIRLDR